MKMKKMTLTEFRNRCHEVVDIVGKTSEPIVIIRNGQPIAQLVPVGRPARDIFGCLAGTIEIVGDIESPVQPAEDWNALR
jgi:prevent-host-death family protein